jgi:hypothetical protein
MSKERTLKKTQSRDTEKLRQIEETKRTEIAEPCRVETTIHTDAERRPHS